MQSFQLLGGKYQQGEQILPGVIQTFRSYQVPTGRPVFIHRIPSEDPAAKEVADLLSAGLIRSPVVRKLLLDVYETEPYRFVVTEPARECVPLLDWLEREADEGSEPEPKTASAPSARVEPIAAPHLSPKSEPAPLPEEPLEEEEEKPKVIEPAGEGDSSEFARLFHEALSGKMERSKRSVLQQEPVVPKPVASAAAAPVVRPNVPRSEDSPAAPAEPLPASVPERDLFQVVETERAGRSTLVIVLVVVAVLALLLVMFVVVFVTR